MENGNLGGDVRDLGYDRKDTLPALAECNYITS
jgi:hypothetical protein